MVAYKFLVSSWAHGKTVWAREGQVYTVRNGMPALYKGEEIAFIACREHRDTKFLPGPQAFEEVLGCPICRGLTLEQDTRLHDPRWAVDIQGLQIVGETQ